MARSDDDSVLVVGAGIAGLALARALAGRGVAARVVDRRMSPPSEGLAINLPANAIHALGDLGLADQVIARGTPIRRREYRSATGRLLFAVDEEAFWGEVGPSVCLRRRDLQGILLDPARPPTWDRMVAGVDAGDQARRPMVHYADGTSSDHPFVVGADGVHSGVRTAVARTAVTRRSRMTDAGWRFMTTNPGLGCWTAWSGRHGTFMLTPVDRHTVYGYASSTRSGTDIGAIDWLRTTFSRFAAPVPATVAAVLDHPDDLHCAVVEEVQCPQWWQGRVVIIGDAAHATGPVWAQGAGLAIEDALVLARLLAQTDSLDRVGPQFELRRRHRVAVVRSATDRMSRIAGMPMWLRNLAAPILGPRAYRSAYGLLRTPYDPDHHTGPPPSAT